ncbi:ClpP-like prohead protease/major capsid protein fusion protein, partial [Rhizobacter sp. Root29]|uniref:ClpP-like prohead protease/major capsid protein fusion protein n=2 Tax=unclassified Rhizobacter TaxID=2640088 RepID=UPI0012FC9AD5
MQTIHIFGEIGTEVTADFIRQELQLIGDKPVLVRINSEGGSVYDGIAIYELLRAHPAHVTVEITGWALSIASVIAMGGRKVVIAPSGLMMVHNPWSTTSGNAADLRRAADTLDVVRGTLITAYQRTGQSEDKLRAWLDAETWFDAEQAKAAGLVDEVADDSYDERPSNARACAFSIPEKYKLRRPALVNLHLPPQSRHDVTRAPDSVPLASAAAPAAAGSIRNEADTGRIIEMFEREIRRAPDSAGDMGKLLIQCLSNKKLTPADAGERILNHMGAGAFPIGGAMYVDDRGQQVWAGSSSSGPSTMHEFKAAASDVLLARAGVPVENPHPASRDLQRLSVLAMAEKVLSMAGLPTYRKSQNEIIKAAMSTSDFPELLANTTGRALRAGYENAQATHAVWTAEREVPDFKPQSLVSLSEAPGLDKVLELADYTYGSFAESAESFRIETFGKIVKISRQALINDDLDAFTRIPQAYGASARRLEADSVYAKLTGSTRLRDDMPLFHEKHGNLAAVGAALSAETLGAARAAMRKQKGLKGLGYFDPQPRFLIVPVSLETKAEQLLASLVDPGMSNNTGNPEWIRRLLLVSDPRLDEVSETAWYLAADPTQHDTIVRAYLAGEPRPYLEENEEFERDAVAHKCRLDFGVGVIDYRGLYKNP